MKGKKGLKKFNISNRLAYTLIVVLTLCLLGIGVFAYGGNTPSVMGHTFGEIAPPTPCISGQILSWSQSYGWICVNQHDCSSFSAQGQGEADARCVSPYIYPNNGGCVVLTGTDGIFASYENSGGWRCRTSAGNTIQASVTCCR